MTCRFVPTKQPKRETTLVRLTRQARAICQLISTHNKAVAREVAKVHRTFKRLEGDEKRNTIERNRLVDLSADLENLDLQFVDD